MGALCSSIRQALGPEDTFSQRGWLPERRDSQSSEILIPAARQPFDLIFAFLEVEGRLRWKEEVGCGQVEFVLLMMMKMYKYNTKHMTQTK